MPSIPAGRDSAQQHGTVGLMRTLSLPKTPYLLRRNDLRRSPFLCPRGTRTSQKPNWGRPMATVAGLLLFPRAPFSHTRSPGGGELGPSAPYSELLLHPQSPVAHSSLPGSQRAPTAQSRTSEPRQGPGHPTGWRAVSRINQVSMFGSDARSRVTPWPSRGAVGRSWPRQGQRVGRVGRGGPAACLPRGARPDSRRTQGMQGMKGRSPDER